MRKFFLCLQMTVQLFYRNWHKKLQSDVFIAYPMGSFFPWCWWVTTNGLKIKSPRPFAWGWNKVIKKSTKKFCPIPPIWLLQLIITIKYQKNKLSRILPLSKLDKCSDFKESHRLINSLPGSTGKILEEHILIHLHTF